MRVKLFKSDFAKVHAVVMLFALVNVLLALALKLRLISGGLYATAVTVHVISGFSILPSLLLVPLLFSNRKLIYRAIRARLLPSWRDFTQKKPLAAAAKFVTLLMALGFVSQTVTALLMRTGLAYRWFPSFDIYTFHTTFVFVLPVLVLLHPILTKLGQRRKAPKQG